MKSVWFTRWPLGLALALASSAAFACAQAQDHFAYMGTLDKKLLILNEDTDAIVGEIQLAGVPRTIVTSPDQQRFYILNTDMEIEIVDLPTRKVAGSINLMEMGGKVRVVAGARNWMNGGGSQARFSGMVVDPTGHYLYASVRVVRKDLNEYHIDPPQFAVIDLATKTVVRRMDFPAEYDTGFGFQASFKVSPDGKYLWVFDDDISILDLATFKVVDKIPLGKPPYPGASPYRLSPTDMPYDGTDKVTSVFVSIDPIVHKGTLGVASMDMASRNVSYNPIGIQLPMIGFVIAPGGKVGYSVMYAGAGANRTTEWWAWDLVNHKVMKKEPFESRSTFSFGMSGDGSKLYMFGSGPSIEIFNAATLKSEKFIDLKKDLTTRVVTLDPTRKATTASQ